MSIFEVTLTHRIAIDAPPEEVWAVFSDITAWPRWNRSVVGTRIVSPAEPWSEGWRFRLTMRVARLTASFTPAITECNPPYRVVWKSTRWGITAYRAFEFTPSASETLVIDEEYLVSRIWPLALVYPRILQRRLSRTWLSCLKEEVERRRGGPAGQASQLS